MNEVISFLFFILIIYCGDSLMAYVAYLVDGSKMPYRKVFLWQIPAAFIQTCVPLGWAIIPNSPVAIVQTLLLLLLRLSELIVIVSWVFFLFRKSDIKRVFFYILSIFPFINISNYGAYVLIDLVMQDNPGFRLEGSILTPDVFFIYLGSFGLSNAIVALTVRAVSKTGFWIKLQAFGNYPKLYIPMCVTCFLGYSVFAHYSNRYISDTWIFVIINVFSLLLLACIVIIVSDIKKTENLIATKNLLIQQQNYITKLESIQKEIRSIQHDYKNMLSGLYAYAGEGNAEAVKEYIETMLLKVDETVREDIRQMNQLIQIEIPELKGQITTKILEAERDGVSFRLEVMFPVNRASMATEDLLRSVGILLDNAIEEARTYEKASVTLLMVQEGKTLTIVVKNPVRGKLDLAQIQNENYSTKGPGRGIGLWNYHNIVRKYPNTVRETKIEGGHLVQVLVLA